MSKGTRWLLLVHAVLSGLLGAVMLLIPGRFLEWLGWGPIDPIISRILGSALVALAWGDFRLWRGSGETGVWLEVQAAFAALGAVAVLRHLLIASWPLMVWLLFIGFLLFAAAWLMALFTGRKS